MASKTIKTMGVTPVTNIIYYGNVNEEKGLWVGERKDVTDMAIGAVFEWFLNQMDGKEELYNKILEYAYNHFEFIEQTIQDYYVYEIWKYKDTLITFSYSNMKMLSEIEKAEDNSVCREFIIHPDGTISGSWNKNMKVIKK